LKYSGSPGGLESRSVRKRDSDSDYTLVMRGAKDPKVACLTARSKAFAGMIALSVVYKKLDKVRQIAVGFRRIIIGDYSRFVICTEELLVSHLTDNNQWSSTWET
jgi:hypothetical protein